MKSGKLKVNKLKLEIQKANGTRSMKWWISMLSHVDRDLVLSAVIPVLANSTI